jgi:hypothetical protein
MKNGEKIKYQRSKIRSQRSRRLAFLLFALCSLLCVSHPVLASSETRDLENPRTKIQNPRSWLLGHPSLWRNRDFRATTVTNGVRDLGSGIRSRIPNPEPRTPILGVVKPDYLINDDMIGGGTQQAAQLAFDTLGNCIIAWEDYKNGDADAIARRFDFSGQALGGSFRPVDDGDMWWQGEPTVGINHHGDAIVAWEDRRGGESNVTAQRYVSGVPVDTNFRINDSTGGDKRASEITVLPDDRMVVVWEDWRRNNGAIYGEVLNPNGQPTGPNFWINSSGTWQAYGATIGSDSLGDFAVAWMDARNGWDVWCQRYDAQAQPQGDNFMVNDDPNPYRINWAPALAMAPSGDFVVAWEDQRNDTLRTEIYAQRYDPTGQLKGVNFRVHDSLPTVNHGNPGVATDRQGNFLITWVDNRSGNNDIWAQLFDAGGSRQGVNFKINDDAGTNQQGGPVVRFSPRGEYWIVWTDLRAANNDIYAQRISASGSLIGSNFRVNDDTFSTQQRVPSIAVNEAGLNITIWEDTRNGGESNIDVYCQLGDPSGNPIGANIRVNTDNVGAPHFYATAAVDQLGNSITAWTDGRSDYNIYAQAFDATGNRTGGNFRVNDGGAMCWSPSAAKDSAGNSVIIYSDMRTGPFKMFGQRYNALNQPVGANFRIDSDTTGGWLQYSSVAMNRHGRFVATWMDQRWGASIYCRVYDSTGTPVGSDFRVNDNEDTVYMGYPVAAMDPSGNFLIAWEDARNRTYTDIYAQRFDPAGNKIGINFRANEDPTQSDQYSPSVAYAPDGRFIILWNDWRDPRNNPEIYVQRYNQNGSLISGNAIINEPSLFYYNHHWSMQRSVAASASRLYFTWTENRRHRGWDNYNKITDWDLIPIAERTATPGPARLSIAASRNPVRGSGIINVLGAVTEDPRSRLTVVAYDVTGRQVARLFAGIPSNPVMSLPLKASELSSGTYFVVARSGDRTAICKIALEE